MSGLTYVTHPKHGVLYAQSFYVYTKRVLCGLCFSERSTYQLKQAQSKLASFITPCICCGETTTPLEILDLDCNIYALRWWHNYDPISHAHNGCEVIAYGNAKEVFHAIPLDSMCKAAVSFFGNELDDDIKLAYKSKGL
jgi:hypothetical protein